MNAREIQKIQIAGVKVYAGIALAICLLAYRPEAGMPTGRGLGRENDLSKV